jgi:CRISPR type III-B/RAMP module RAMP protein Cmr1
MKAVTFELKFLTAALIGGAYPKSQNGHPANAELRPPSIRGLLRWWHRFLGHDSAAERRIFGSVAGDQGTASGFILRVIDPPEPSREPRTAKQIGLHDSQIVEYLAFNLRNQEDARSMLSEGSRFHLTLINRSLSSADWSHLVSLARTLGWLGALGTRSRRCFGALTIVSENGKAAVPPGDWTDLLSRSVSAVSIPSVRGSSRTEFLIKAGRWLKGQRADLGVRKTHIFGTAGKKERLASPVLLRPVECDEGLLLVAIGHPGHLREIGLAPAIRQEAPMPAGAMPSDPVASLLAPPFDFPSIQRYKSQVLEWQSGGRTDLVSRFVQLTQEPKYGGLRKQPWYPEGHA